MSPISAYQLIWITLYQQFGGLERQYAVNMMAAAGLHVEMHVGKAARSQLLSGK
jgi:hypothetical protein